MSNWTTTARAALDTYLEKHRTAAQASGGDGDEVAADLRRHVEQELAAENLSAVTEQDVQRVLMRLGPAPEAPKTVTTPPAEKKTPGRTGSIFIAILGVLLPLTALTVELFTAACGSTFLDPIPSWIHVFLIALVPLANFLVLLDRPLSEAQFRWLWRLTGAAAGVCICYTIVFLPLSPLAAIGIIAYGIGLLPLSPVLALPCVFAARDRLKQKLALQNRPIPGRWWTSAAVAVLLLVLLALPAPLTRMWIAKAGAESAEEANRAVQMLRRLGSEEVMLRECYGRRSRELEFNFSAEKTSAEQAQKVYYRVTGRPFNSVPPPMNKWQARGRMMFDEFEWDSGLGGDSVAGQVKGLSLISSRLDGNSDPEEGWAYVEWIMEFRNAHEWSEREARAQIQLPPGGVVSRLTLWVNGEEREAAFSGRSQVKEAYQKVAIQQRRDPVLVTTSGPDRVLMQCFPVPARGGTMKIRMGITAPLVMMGPNRNALRLPVIAERNFKVPASLFHSVWLESPRPISTKASKLVTEAGKKDSWGIHGELSPEEMASPQSILWFEGTPQAITATSRNWGDAAAVKVHQTPGPLPAVMPGRVAIIVDGSVGMTESYPKISKALRGIPAETEVGVWMARDRVEQLALGMDRMPGAFAHIDGLKGVGGQDNLPALLVGWEWASAKPNSTVIWIHGPQPVLLTAPERLQQRLEWRGEGHGPAIVDVPVTHGPNRVAEKIVASGVMKSLMRLGALEEDLDWLFGTWNQRHTQYAVNRTLEKGEAPSGVAKSSAHVLRLWAADEIARLAKARKVPEAIAIASTYQLVTAVSGAVVLETKQQFAAAGLTPVSSSSVPTFSTPDSAYTLVLLLLAFVIMAIWRRRIVRNGAAFFKRI